jgi:hypothetical protein
MMLMNVVHTFCITTAKTTPVLLIREIIAVYWENHVRISGFIYVNVGSISSNHCALKVNL